MHHYVTLEAIHFLPGGREGGREGGRRRDTIGID